MATNILSSLLAAADPSDVMSSATSFSRKEKEKNPESEALREVIKAWAKEGNIKALSAIDEGGFAEKHGMGDAVKALIAGLGGQEKLTQINQQEQEKQSQQEGFGRLIRGLFGIPQKNAASDVNPQNPLAPYTPTTSIDNTQFTKVTPSPTQGMELSNASPDAQGNWNIGLRKSAKAKHDLSMQEQVFSQLMAENNNDAVSAFKKFQEIHQPEVRTFEYTDAKTGQKSILYKNNKGETIYDSGPLGGIKPEKSDNSVSLTPEAIAALAERFQQTGELPGLGMGRAATTSRSAILNKWAEDINSPNQAVAQAAYKAGRNELSQLQAQRGKIMAFAKTADKNLALVEQLSDAVERSDIPALNKILLPFKMQVQGAADVAGLNAVTRIAINETARVLSSATGAGVLSDTARKEVEDVLNKAQNPAQIKQVIGLLRQDMQNRQAGYDEQISEITQALFGVGNSNQNKQAQTTETTQPAQSTPQSLSAPSQQNLPTPKTAEEYLKRRRGQ